MGPRAHEDVLVRGQQGAYRVHGGPFGGGPPESCHPCTPPPERPHSDRGGRPRRQHRPAPPPAAAAGVGHARVRRAVGRGRPLLLRPLHAARRGHRLPRPLLARAARDRAGLDRRHGAAGRRGARGRRGRDRRPPPRLRRRPAAGRGRRHRRRLADLVPGARRPRRLRLDGVRDDGLRPRRARERHERRAPAGRPQQARRPAAGHGRRRPGARAGRRDVAARLPARRRPRVPAVARPGRELRDDHRSASACRSWP